MPTTDARTSPHDTFWGRWVAVGVAFVSALRGLGRLAASGSSLPAGGERADVRFEPSDITSRNVVITGFSILGGMWLFAAAIFIYFRYVQTHVPEATVAASPARPNGLLPPEPRLQLSPRTDYQAFLADENAQLHRYAWVDRSHGIVSIPIDRAMEIVARRGIPAQKTPADLKLYPPTAGTRDTGFEGKVAEPR